MPLIRDSWLNERRYTSIIENRSREQRKKKILAEGETLRRSSARIYATIRQD